MKYSNNDNRIVVWMVSKHSANMNCNRNHGHDNSNKMRQTCAANLPLVTRAWKTGSNSSYDCTPFLHSLLTKGKQREDQTPSARKALAVWWFPQDVGMLPPSVNPQSPCPPNPS